MRRDIGSSNAMLCRWCEIIVLRRVNCVGRRGDLSAFASRYAPQKRQQSTWSSRPLNARIRNSCPDDRPRGLFAGQRYASSEFKSSSGGIDDVLGETRAILGSSAVPAEEAILKALESCKTFALGVSDEAKSSESQEKSPTSSLLSLEESNAQDGKQDAAREIRNVDLVSLAVYEMMKHPPVFISNDALAKYTHIQTALRRPHTIPDVFALYAEKAIPRKGSNPVRYSNTKPSKIQFAISREVADQALECAIAQRDLSLCLAIISTSISTKAFRRKKFFSRALVPLTGAALAPAAAYILATKVADLQNTMEPHVATGIAFAGILTYVSATGMMGFLALTTANDQMDRVTWATGTPLRERWVREEERAALDKIAGAWGFKNSERRGEEEGEEWETLKDWIGTRRMVLDRVELMEGMQ